MARASKKAKPKEPEKITVTVRHQPTLVTISVPQKGYYPGTFTITLDDAIEVRAQLERALTTATRPDPGKADR